MQKRLLIIYLFLFSYAGAVAHSVVPHHHHVSSTEAKGHHHHDSADHPNEDSSNKGAGDEGQPYFLIHASNADVSVDSGSTVNTVKFKTTQFPILLSESISPVSIADHNVFHPPMFDGVPLLVFLSSRSLRAPPLLSI